MLKSYIAFDIETTGLNPEENEIIEIGALKVRDGKVQQRFIEFIRPVEAISSSITKLTGITNDMVENAKPRQEIIPEFLEFCGDDILIGHNVIFDYSFVKVNALAEGMAFERAGIDTLKIARKVHKELESKSLGNLCQHYNIENNAAHRAYHDALATAKLYQTLSHFFEENEPKLFQPAPLKYKQKKVMAATPKQIAFIKKLMRNHGTEMIWNPDTITKNEASKLIEDILNGENKAD
jgi:DNA polymerase-3 subunit epsilon